MEEMSLSRSEKVKDSSRRLLFFTVRTLVGFLLGLVLSLIGREIFSYGDFSFIFVMVVVCMSILKISREWSYKGLAIFSVFCFLIGLLLKMYIHHAPGV